MKYFLLTTPRSRDQVEIGFDEVEKRIRAIRSKDTADRILEISQVSAGIIYLHEDGQSQDDYEAIVIHDVP